MATTVETKRDEGGGRQRGASIRTSGGVKELERCHRDLRLYISVCWHDLAHATFRPTRTASTHGTTPPRAIIEFKGTLNGCVRLMKPSLASHAARRTPFASSFNHTLRGLRGLRGPRGLDCEPSIPAPPVGAAPPPRALQPRLWLRSGSEAASNSRGSMPSLPGPSRRAPQIASLVPSRMVPSFTRCASASSRMASIEYLIAA